MFEKYIHSDVEQAILSRFIYHPEEVAVYPDLESKHFLFEKNKKIYEAILKLSAGKEPLTPKTIQDESGVEFDYLMDLIKDETVLAVDLMIKYLIKESNKFIVLKETSELLKEVEDNKDIDVYGRLSDLSLKNEKFTETVSNEQILMELQERMKTGITGISSGIKEIDDYINAFQPGRLYVVGARPSMGKSAFMCSLAEFIEREKKVGILSLEMKVSEIKQRMACLRANIRHWKIEKGKCSGEEFDAYAKAIYSLKNTIINDKGGLNINQIVGIIRMFVKKAKCDIVFIDHIGLIKINSNGNIAHEIGENTSALKALAKELNIPIVCLCQLNRLADKNQNDPPKISDLRDSGRIEEDADCVILLFRDNYYNTIGTGTARYVIGKCRNGKTGYANGFFESEMMRWS